MNIRFIFLIFLVSSCGGGGSSAILVPPEEPPSSPYQAHVCENYDGPMENIIWIDDFMDLVYTNNWIAIIGNGAEYGIPGWGNNENQYYTSNLKNSSVVNGCLRITPLNESINNFNYTSAKLVTENKVDFTQPGRITVRFRSPEGVGMWPAIWMMPLESIYGGWPASGEIDLVEIRGDNMQEILSTVHYGSDPSNHKFQGGSYFLPQSNNLNERFEAALKLAKLPKNSAKIRVRNRCEITGRPHGYYRKLKMSRIALRKLASSGKIPGMTKSSW